jgi:hypothetical protein|tara:strand:- start:137 stop:430 length:294 start_codon:yes stop_codon:yes gene_type:complete
MSNTTETNTTETRFGNQITANKTLTEIACKLVTEQIHSSISWIGMGNASTIEKIEEIPSWSTDASRIVEIYNLAKTLEVLRANHKAMVRELNEKDED